jgi:hypothetical protein
MLVMIVNDDDDDDDHQMKEFFLLMIVPLMNDQHLVMMPLQLLRKMDAIKPQQQPLLHVALLHVHDLDPLEKAKKNK